MGQKAGTAMHYAGDAAGRMASGVVNVVRRHPIPTLLIGAGIVWAWAERNRSTENGNGHESLYPGEPEEQTGWRETEGTGEQAAKEMMSSAGEKVQSKVAAAGGVLKEKGRRAFESVRSVGSK